MKYIINKQTKYRRDWIVIGLLYGMVFFMGTTVYWWLAWYTK